MTFFQSIFLGIVEGITEFLPISSTGHLILVSELLRIPQTEFLKSFEIAIQLGAILSIIVLYGRRLLREWNIISRIILAFIPTAIIGLLLYSFIKQFLLGNTVVVLSALFIGGLGIILFEKWYEKKEKRMGNEKKRIEGLENIGKRDAFLIGLFQSLAIIPGVSRAAATIIGGLVLNVDRKTVVEFSFLLALPTMLAATGLDLLKSAHAFTSPEIVLLLTSLFVSFVTALFAVKFLLSYIERHSFTAFGWYRIGLSVLLALIFFL